MDLREIVDLITIRQYVVNSTANPTVDRATVNVLNGMLLMIDKKILGLLQTSEFKEYVNFADVRKALEDAAQVTNIRSGLVRNPNTGQLENPQRKK